LPLKAPRKERRSIILFRWTKGLCANAIRSEMLPVYADKYFRRRALHVWCKKFVYGRESVVVEERPGFVLFRPSMTNAMIAAVNSPIWSDQCMMRCLNEFGRYVEK